MKTVFYYTSSYFLDISLEVIKSLKSSVNLHVLIEITPSSKNANIMNLDSLPVGKCLVTPQELLAETDYNFIKPFFSGVASVHFVIHDHPTGVSLRTLKTARTVRKYIKQFNPDAIHFEGFTLRTLALAPLMLRIKKTTLSVHDAVLHSGEKTWKSTLPRLIFFHAPVKKSFIFYSQFSRNQFFLNNSKQKWKLIVTRMFPFSYFSSLPVSPDKQQVNILFFGRISKYKGVTMLLDAMPEVLRQHPDAQLIIAGKGADESILSNENLNKLSNNIKLINRYIPNSELAQLLTEAKFVVCPYTDASQSGVLMTSFAMCKPVIATNVGAFSEYISHNHNGKLIEPNTRELVDGINEMLNNDFYKHLQQNIQADNKKEGWHNNVSKLLNVWTGMS